MTIKKCSAKRKSPKKNDRAKKKEGGSEKKKTRDLRKKRGGKGGTRDNSPPEGRKKREKKASRSGSWSPGMNKKMENHGQSPEGKRFWGEKKKRKQKKKEHKGGSLGYQALKPAPGQKTEKGKGGGFATRE